VTEDDSDETYAFEMDEGNEMPISIDASDPLDVIVWDEQDVKAAQSRTGIALANGAGGGCYTGLLGLAKLSHFGPCTQFHLRLAAWLQAALFAIPRICDKPRCGWPSAMGPEVCS